LKRLPYKVGMSTIVVLDSFKLTSLAVASQKKWGIYISADSDPELYHEFLTRISEVSTNAMAELSSFGVFLFDTPEAMDSVFKVLNQAPFYSSALFAYTLSPEGEIISENT